MRRGGGDGGKARDGGGGGGGGGGGEERRERRPLSEDWTRDATDLDEANSPDPEDEKTDEEDENEDDSTKVIMKDFLVSVLNIVSGLSRDKKVKVRKKKKDPN